MCSTGRPYAATCKQARITLSRAQAAAAHSFVAVIKLNFTRPIWKPRAISGITSAP